MAHNGNKISNLMLTSYYNWSVCHKNVYTDLEVLWLVNISTHNCCHQHLESVESEHISGIDRQWLLQKWQICILLYARKRYSEST